MFGLDVGPGLSTAQSLLPGRPQNLAWSKNPFFTNFNQNYLPRYIKPLFRFNRWMFYSHDIFGTIVRKLAEYPITDVMVNPPVGAHLTPEFSKTSVTAWKDFLDNEVEIRKVMLGMGLDYFVYGNSFVLPIAARLHYYRCVGCDMTFSSDDPRLELRRFDKEQKKFRHKCFKCGETWLVVETPQKPVVEFVRPLRLNPENFEIDYNPLSGESTYFYQIPGKVKTKLMMGAEGAEYRKWLPPKFVAAALSDGVLKFKKDHLFHFAAPGLAEEDMGWGKPPSLNVMQAIYQMAVVRRAEEAICNEHIVPMRILFPNAANGMNPMEWGDMASWQAQLQQWIYLWKLDENIMPITNFPVGVANIGGDSRALLSTPQLQEFYKLQIINGMEVPREFVEGGLSFSGSSMSLRMLQNKFDSMRISFDRFLDFFKKFAVRTKGLPDVALSFAPLRLADDVQKTQMMLQLMDKGLVSRSTALSHVGFNYDEERARIKVELESDREMKALEARTAAESSKETMIIQARGQAEAEYEGFRAQQELQDKERKRQLMEQQVSRRNEMMTMNDEELQQFVLSGGASVSDVIYLANHNRIPKEILHELIDTVVNMQRQVLEQFGINPVTMDGLPPDLATQINNNIMPPKDIAGIIQGMQAQAAAEAAAAQQGGAGGGQPPQGGGGKPQQAQGGGGAPQQNGADTRAKKYSQQLEAEQSPQGKSVIMSDIKSKDPEGFAALQQAQHQQQQGAPMPQQLPPRRNGGNHMG